MTKSNSRVRRLSYSRLNGTTILYSGLISAALLFGDAKYGWAESKKLEFATAAISSYSSEDYDQPLFRFASDGSGQTSAPSADLTKLSQWTSHAEGAIFVTGNSGDIFGNISLFLPAYQTGDGLVFVDLRGDFGDHSSRQGSVGFGYRHIAPNLFFGQDAIFGVNAYVDLLRSENANQFVQGSLGLELITRNLEFQANAYMAEDEPRLLTSTAFSNPGLNGTAVVQQSGTRFQFENAFSGFDLEGAFKIELSEDSLLRAHAGYYEFERGSDSFKGPRAGLEWGLENAFGLAGSRVSVGAEVYDDNQLGTDFNGFLRLRVPLGSKSQTSGAQQGSILDLDRQMTNRVRRQGRIFTETITTQNVVETPILDAASGQPLHAFFISEVSLGLGDCSSVFNACTFDTASASPNLGAGDAFIAINGGGPNSSVLTFSANNQQIVGGGGTGSAVLSFSDANNSTIVLNGLGGRPQVAGVDVGAYNDTSISGITTTAPGGIVGNGFGGTLNINDVHTNTGGINLTNPNMAVVSVTNSILNGMGNAGVTATSGTPGGLRFNLSNNTISTSGTGPAVDVSGTDAGDVLVTGFANNTITGTGGVSFDNVTFDADGDPSNGISQVAGGALSIGTAGAPVTGIGLNLNEVLGSLAFASLEVVNDAGTGVFVRDDAGKAGSFTFGTGGGNVTTTNGTGVDIDPVTLDLTLDSLTVNGGVNGVLLDEVTGTFNVIGGAISNTSGVAFSLSNSDIDVSFGATIDNASGQSVSITNQTGGTIDFTGAISDTGDGVDLQSNPGATIGFSGGLDIDTTGATGLNATGGGTISITGNANTIDTMNAAALVLEDVTIGASGLAFASLSSTDAADDGISLVDVTGGMLDVSGATLITNPGVAGIDVEGINTAGFNFGDLDIALSGDNQSGIDLQSATVNGDITASDFDLTATSAIGTTAVDLSGTVGGGTIQLGDTSAAGENASISGVDVGVQFSAGTNTTFIFGDGELATDELSTISATTAISANPAPTNGSYNFLDVDLTAATLDFAATTMGDFVFVAATATGDGSGNDTANFANVTTADAITTSNTIFVMVNDGNDIIDADGFSLEQGQNIDGFGNGSTLTVGTIVPPGFVGVPSSSTSIADPTGNGAATLSSAGFTVIDAAGDNQVENVVVGAGLVGVDVNGDNVILGGADGALVVDGSATGVSLDEATGFVVSNLIIQNSATVGLTVNDTALGTLNLDNLTVQNNQVGVQFNAFGGGQTGAVNFGPAVSISNSNSVGLSVQGPSAQADISFAGSITQSGGAGTVAVTNGAMGSLTFSAGSSITSTGGTGLQFDNADGIYAFNGATTLNGGDAGIDILNDSAGTFTFGTGTVITSPTGSAFNVDGSAADVIFNGTITQSSTANAVSISNTTGGTLDFAGLITANTGTSTGIDLMNNAGATVNFTGGLDIDTSTGTGFSATGGGTVSVTGGTSTIASTAGQAIALDGIAADQTFGSITSGGGTNGISINDVSGNFTSDSTTISGTTGDGISVSNSALDVALNGTTSVTGSGDDNVEVNATSGTVTVADLQSVNATDNGVELLGNSGTVTVTGGQVSQNGASNNVAVLVDGGTGDVDFGAQVDVSASSAGAGNAAAGVRIDNTTGGTLNFTGAINNTGDGFAVDIAPNSRLDNTTINFTGSQITDTGGGQGISVTGLEATSSTSFSSSTAVTLTDIAGGSAIYVGDGLGFNNGDVSFGGPVTIDSSAEFGILLEFNAGNTVSFGDAVMVTDTQSFAGVGAFDNAGATINFTGGTSIQGSIGDGFVAADGGTFNITGTNSVSSTGTGFLGNSLFLDTVEIGTSGVTFASVTASGTGANAAVGDVIIVTDVTGDTLTVDAVNIAETSGGGHDGIEINGGSADLTFGTAIISNAADEGIEIQNNYSGTVTFTGAVSIANAVTAGIDLENIDGTVAFNGTTSIQLGADAGARGINFDGTINAVSFGATTITGVGSGTNQVGIDFNAATLNDTVSFQSADISGPTTSTNSIGIDLTGVLGDQTVTVGEQVTAGASSSITGLHRGVVIDNTAAVQFTFGDGEGLIDTGSLIDVNGQAGSFLIDAGGGTLPGSSFNFNDVSFGVGDNFHFPAASSAPVFVSEAGGIVSTGVNNLSADVTTVTVAAAEAQANTGQTFVFVGDAAGAIDMSGGGIDGFTLNVGQSIDGFADGNAITFGLLVPTNIMGDFGSIGGSVTSDDVTAGNTAAGVTGIVTSNAAGSHMILNFDIDASGLGALSSALGIYNATTASTVYNVDVSNVDNGSRGITIESSDANLSNLSVTGTPSGAGQGINILAVGSSASVNLNNVTVTNAGAQALNIENIAGGVTVSGTGNSASHTTGQAVVVNNATIGATGLTFDSVTTSLTASANAIDINNAAGGTLTFTSVDLAGTAATTGLDISGNTRTSNVVVSGGVIANGIRIQGSGTGTVQVDADISETAGFAAQVANRGAGAGDVTVNGTVTGATGTVSIANNTAGNVTFTNTVTGTGTNNVGAINILNNSGGTLTFAGLVDLDMTNAGLGVNLQNSNAGLTTTFTGGLDINTVNGVGFNALSGTVAVAATAGSEQVTTTGTGAAVVLDGVTVAGGGITFDGVTTSTTASAESIDINNAAGGTITFTSVDLAGTAGTTGLDISGGSRSSNVVVTGGTIASGVRVQGSGTGTVQIGANISDNAGYAVQVANRGAGAGDVTVNGTVTNNTGAVSIGNNSDGNVTFTNTVTGIGSNNVGAVNIFSNSGGTLSFTGLVDLDVTGAGIGVNQQASNSGLTTNFTGGLDINSVNGIGFNALSGTVAVAATAGSEQVTTTGTAAAVVLDNMTVAAGGITFDSIQSSNSASDGISLTNVTGGAVAVTGLTSITNPGVAGIDIEGMNSSSFTFADVDMVLGANNSTGIDVSTATLNANVTATDFDLTSTTATGTTGVDLAGVTGTGALTLGDTTAPFATGADATIAGVATGVQFSAGTDIDFVFGDGELVSDTDSSIAATTILGGTLPGTGTYDFEDVLFTGDTSSLSGISLFYATDTGIGSNDGSSFTNAGTLLAAETATGVDAVIVFDRTDNSSADTINLGAQTFDLDNGQVLVSITEGMTIDLSDYGLTASGPGAHFAFNPAAGAGGSSVVTAPTVGVDTLHPVIQSSADAINILGEGAIVNVNAVSTAANGIVYSGNVTGDFVLQNAIATGATFGFNLDATGGVMTIAGSGNQGFGTGTGGVVRLVDINTGTITHGTSTYTGLTFASATTAGTGAGRGGLHLANLSASGTESFDFTTVALATTGTGLGIDISDATADINVTGGTITNSGSSGSSIRITETAAPGGGGDFTINSNVNSTAGASIGFAVEIDGLTGGTIGFGGNFIDTSFINAGGIQITNLDTGGPTTVNFTGNVQANTGGAEAVVLTNNDAATINFTGGMDLDTTSDEAFTATGGGTINVSGASNTINTSSGRPVVMSDVTIGASGVTFASIASSGVVANDALSFINVDGGTFNGGAVTVAGTSGAGSDGIEVSGGSSSSFTFASASISNTASNGINLNGNAGSFTVTGQTTIDNPGATGIQVTNNPGAYTFGNVTINNRNSAGIAINGFTGGVQTGQFGTVTINNQNTSNTSAFAIDNIVSVGSTITVASVAIDNNGSNSSAIAASNNDGATININGGSVTNAAGAAVSVSSSSGAFTYAGTISNTSGRSVQVLNNESGSSTTFSGNITDTGGQGIVVSGNTASTVAFTGNVTLNTAASTALTLQNNANGTIGFTGPLDIDTTTATGFSSNNGGSVNITGGMTINTTSGTGASFISGGAGTVTVSGGATNTIETLSGEVLNISSQTMNATFASASGTALNGNKGIDINNMSGSLTINGGTITNVGGGESIEITGGNGTISIATAVNTTSNSASGLAIDISGRSGGTITLSGNLTDTVGLGGGINISSNQGTINLSGGTKQVNTVTATAVNVASNNAAATINFTGGGLDIDTTTGAGFIATGGGTVTVQGTGNTINTGTGQAVNINGVSIGAGGVTFQSISQNGGTVGIALNNTGTSGGFMVTGDGTGVVNGSGGTIQNTQEDGIRLSNTMNASFTQLNLTDNAQQGDNFIGDDHAIDIDNVTNFTFQDAVINGFGNSTLSHADQHSISILNLFGTSLIDNVTFDDMNEDGIEYINTTTDNATRDVLTVRGSTFNNHLAANGESAIQAEAQGTANMGLVVDNSTFNINANGTLGVLASSIGTSSFNVTVQNSTFNAGSSFGAGTILISNAGSSTATNMITGNTINGAPFNGIDVLNNDDATSSTTISNNMIDGSGVGIGLNNGFGIRVQQDENGSMTVLIDNNTISDFSASHVRVIARDTTDGTGIMNATVTNNTSTNAPDSFVYGAEILAQDSNTVCVDLRGNNFIGNDGGFPGFGDDIRLGNGAVSTLNVEQASAAAITAANNGDSVSVGGTVTFNASNCPVP